MRCYPGTRIQAVMLCAVLLLAAGISRAAVPFPDGAPYRIILNLTENPDTSMAVTWRTDDPVAAPQAQIAPAAEFVNDLGRNAWTLTAATKAVKLDRDAATIGAAGADAVGRDRTAYSHSAVFEGLEPDTLYEYRVGDGGLWSEWSQFRTAASGPEPFSFVYLGDPQNRLKSTCSRIFHAAYSKAPDADFWMFVGDLVNHGHVDEEWAEFFYALGWIPRRTPMIMLPGNHEYVKSDDRAPRFRSGRPMALSVVDLAHLWNPNFTLPKNGPEGLEETAYYIDYQGVRFVMLNGNELIEEQAEWLEELLADNPQQWTVVAIHQPFYSTGGDRDNPYQRQLFVRTFDKYSVDLVLQGHDHSYGRTYRMRNGVRVADNEPGTVYVVTVSGPKQYDLNPRYEGLMPVMGTGRQLFQVISVDRGRLSYESYTATGELYDSFVLAK